MDTLPVVLRELNGTTFKSTKGHAAKLLGRVGSCNQELGLEVWGHEKEWPADQRDRPMVNLRIKIYPGRIGCTVLLVVQVNISKVS